MSRRAPAGQRAALDRSTRRIELSGMRHPVPAPPDARRARPPRQPDARLGGWFGACAVVALTACAGARAPGVAEVPANRPPVAVPDAWAGPVDWPAVPLPAVPAVRGPLAVRVVHPTEGLLLGVDSTFVFGSVGSGDAALTINGVRVPVAANGAFLAWLPVPSARSPRYELVASAGRDTARAGVRIRRPVRRALAATGPLVVDSASLQPRGRWSGRPDEPVRLSVRAPANATAWVRTVRGDRVPLVRATELRRATDSATRRAGPAAGPDPAGDSNGDAGTLFLGEVRADALGPRSRVVIARGADTVQLATLVPDVAPSGGARRFALLRSRAEGLAAEGDSEQVVIAQPVPDGFYKWALLPGTALELTGAQGDFTRVRLDAQLEAWVATADLVPLPVGTPAPRRQSGGLRVVPDTGWVDIRIPTGERPAFLVEPDGDRLVVTFYDTRFSPSISPMLGTDPLVRQLAWEPVASDRTRLEVRLGAPVFGWQVSWDDARGALVLRVRRVPRIDPAAPLRGLVLAVDAGHPPGGATGPTGLTEAAAVLPVAAQLATLLEARGARVVRTRPTSAAVPLGDRPVLARRAGAHALLSVHLNAFADGTNPFVQHGTSTLFFHQPSEPLARAVQQRLMAAIGQRDLGIHYQNLAVARPTWFPSVLAEGLFLMFPDQEAAMRSPEWQARYARAIADGAEAYFRALGARAAAMAAARE
jgi:N-acetylmuramoyl-L-alanine amidase